MPGPGVISVTGSSKLAVGLGGKFTADGVTMPNAPLPPPDPRGAMEISFAGVAPCPLDPAPARPAAPCGAASPTADPPPPGPGDAPGTPPAASGPFKGCCARETSERSGDDGSVAKRELSGAGTVSVQSASTSS